MKKRFPFGSDVFRIAPLPPCHRSHKRRLDIIFVLIVKVVNPLSCAAHTLVIICIQKLVSLRTFRRAGGNPCWAIFI